MVTAILVGVGAGAITFIACAGFVYLIGRQPTEQEDARNYMDESIQMQGDHFVKLRALHERQAIALESIAASLEKLAGCVSNHDTSDWHIRTQPHP